MKYSNVCRESEHKKILKKKEKNQIVQPSALSLLLLEEELIGQHCLHPKES
jgi:hypothetical protein